MPDNIDLARILVAVTELRADMKRWRQETERLVRGAGFVDEGPDTASDNPLVRDADDRQRELHCDLQDMFGEQVKTTSMMIRGLSEEMTKYVKDLCKLEEKLQPWFRRDDRGLDLAQRVQFLMRMREESDKEIASLRQRLEERHG